MRTTHVGTRGYQAPELLLDRPYDLTSDIFSVGVILFMLLAGYPPFEQAHVSDRWFKPIARKNYEKFWRNHRTSSIANNKAVKDLLQRMLSFDPKDRISITDIKKHEWFNGKYFEGKDLIRALRNRHHKMEMKRKKDLDKQADLQTSIGRPIKRGGHGNMCVPLVPDYIDETIGMLHSTVDWQHMMETMEYAIPGIGSCSLSSESTKLYFTVKVASRDLQGGTVKFSTQIFLSRLYNNDKVFAAISADTTLTSGLKPCYAIKIERITGDALDFQRVKRGFIDRCGHDFTGVPEDRRVKMEDAYIDTDDEYDDYDQLLTSEGFK